MTKYKILRGQDTSPVESPLFGVVGEAEGSSSKDAIKVFLAEGENAETFGEGTYVAVPARSWDPQPIAKKISFG